MVRAVLGLLAFMLLVAPSPASGASVQLRVYGAPNSAPLVPRTAVALPPADIGTPPNTCGANTAIGALQAAVGASSWSGTWTDGKVTVDRIGPVTAAAGTRWRLYVNNMRQDNGPCSQPLRDGDDVLFYLACDGSDHGCYSKEPSILTAPATAAPDQPFNVMAGRVKTVDSQALPTVYSNEIVPFAIIMADGRPYAADQYAVAVIFFAARGPHQLSLSEPGRVPDVRIVCVTNGHDGYCGTTPIDPAQTPAFDVNAFPSGLCETNGHDGLCGTVDTTGPAAAVTSLNQRRLYKRGRGPGQLKGTVEVDQAGIKTVRLMLTRTATTVVRAKRKRKARSKAKASKSDMARVAATKKKPRTRKKTQRGRRVRTCTYWSHETALLERAKRCGMKGGKWWTPDLDDDTGNQNWSYHFNMTLPHGRYVLQVQAQDRLGNWGPIERNRSLVTFTVR